MPSNADLAQQMSLLINSWQTYIDQQIQLDNGVAGYTSTPVNGVAQPGPGYYPITMPNGTTTWRPCIDLINVNSQAFKVISRAGTSSASQTVQTTDSGKVVLVSNTGGTTNVTVTFPVGLPIGFHAIYVSWPPMGILKFAGATNVTLRSDQNLNAGRANYSMVTAIVPATNQVLLQGSMIAA